ncbi:sulfurtransferase [Leucobacter sp. M11]|uniref:sulfurtransferase n=1 Tax=Leucobacter sp. M11 TaxID=2993565 RepID=UPI002D802E3F|nr:sulfurtransferase [Leucobacter sp. M11]MEB4613565.1 sulfurtransferase [Leucobacter sp. M11]
MSILISAAELRAALAVPEHRIRVLDVRWSLGGPPGIGLFREAHLPGAVFVDLETELAAPASAEGGRHPLPAPEALQAAARSWGLNDGDRVVAYDGGGNLAAARARWLLRDAGVAEVLLLDGALPAWIDAGYPVESGLVTPPPGTVTLTSGRLPRLSIDQAAALPEAGVLLDARAPERFRGETEPIDPRAGHIPGARNAPAAENLDGSGRFRSPEELRARFAALGVTPGTPVGVYCGSGVTAAATATALELAGFAPALFPGSWSQWSQDPARPAATGA